MDLFEANTSNASKVLKESWSQFSIPQKIQIALVEKELTEVVKIITNDLQFQYNLTEAELTADQIDTIFGDVVKAMGDRAAGSLERSGVNKAVGKTVKIGGKALTLSKDALVAVDKKLNDLGAMVKQTEPVKNLDATVKSLQAKIRANLEKGPVGNEIMGMVDKYAQFAKDNPMKSAIIIGALTTVAGIAGGPVGGAAAGYLLRGVNGLIKGEDFSTVVGQGAKFAAYGLAIGFLADEIGEFFSGDENLATVRGTVDSNDIADAGGNSAQFIPTFENNEEYIDYFARKIYEERLEDLPGGGEFDLEKLERIKESIVVTGDVTQGSIQASVDGGFVMGDNWLTQDQMAEYSRLKGNSMMGTPESREYLKSLYPENEINVPPPKPLSPEVIAARKAAGITASYDIDRIVALSGASKLNEFDLKGALKKVGGAIKKGASAVNKAAQDVGATTPEKLKKAWNDAGAPTDDAGLYNFLVNTAGVPLDSVQTAYKNSKIDINTNNKSADQEQEKKPEEPKADTPNLTGKYATQGVDGDRIKTGTDAQKQTGGQEKTGTIDIPTIAKQIMALSANDKTKIIQALTPKPAESIEKEDLVLENMNDDKTTYNLSISKSKDGTSMNSNITTDKPDDLMRILSLAGMADKMSKPEMEMEPEMDHAEPESPCGCGDSPCGCGEAVEENRLSKEKYYDTDYMVNDLAGGINRPKKMYKRASPGDNPMSVSEAVDLKEEYKRYKASKNK